MSELLVKSFGVKAGFTLTDPADPRYQKVVKQRNRYGEVILQAASILQRNADGEDHIDAVVGVVRAIDVYLLSYGLSRSSSDAIQRNFVQARE